MKFASSALEIPSYERGMARVLGYDRVTSVKVV